MTQMRTTASKGVFISRTATLWSANKLWSGELLEALLEAIASSGGRALSGTTAATANTRGPTGATPTVRRGEAVVGFYSGRHEQGALRAGALVGGCWRWGTPQRHTPRALGLRPNGGDRRPRLHVVVVAVLRGGCFRRFKRHRSRRAFPSRPGGCTCAL